VTSQQVIKLRRPTVTTAGNGTTFKVADFSTHLSGPTASLFLRAAGAEVVKIENPRFGDGNRWMDSSPQVGGGSIYHHAINWGAKSIAVDPQSDAWPEWVRALTQWADVVIVGGRPSDASRLGLDADTVQGINDQIIYCHISGYGDRGPWLERTAHGQNPDALAGLVDVMRTASGGFEPVGWRPAGTSFAGVCAALGILGALYHREVTGHPLTVRTSLWEAALWWNWRELTAQATVGEKWGVVKDFGSRYAIYRTADDRPILLAPIEQKFWEAFCDAAGLTDLRYRGDWSTRYDFGSAERESAERTQIAEIIAAKTLDEWISILEETRVPFCEVLEASRVLETEQLRSIEMLVEIPGTDFVALRPPVRLTGDETLEAIAARRRLPGLGEHTEEFRRRLGLP
jgi:crotonobetainyl-CoA:carnitine CoA-transferase CaiB-like acyl-CoA transferase